HPCTVHIVEATSGVVRVVRIALPNRDSVLLTTGHRAPPMNPDASCQLHADDVECEDGVLRIIGRWRYLKQSDSAGHRIGDPRAVHATWGDVSLLREERDSTGEVVRPGLRLPQIGALHAIAAHWTLEPTAPALVVLPTGTGKTEVMIASLIMHRP